MTKTRSNLTFFLYYCDVKINCVHLLVKIVEIA